MVTLNISHTNDGDLDIFLVDPSGTKAILLSSDNGGSGNHYTSTVFRTMYAVNSITTGTSPFTGTFIPEGSISTAPDRTGAAGGGNYNLVIPANALNGASIDGTWSLRVFDDANSTTGTIVSWSLSVTKQTGTGFTTVVNGSPTIGAVAYSGIFNSIATSVVTPPAGTNNYTVTTTDEDGCSATSNQVTLVVKPSPKPTIVADYCSHQPKIKLSATGSGSYLWSTGETTSTIDIDLVGIYTVTETGANGCTGTASINVSNELVVNGDFSSGNTGFVTPPSGANQYSYVSDIAGNSELNPEGLYGIGNNANNYHSNFWGFDHTTGTGKFMIVNGFPGAPQPVVWQQTHPVQPNTDYYFSAYAMSLNTAGNYAQLQFSINGTQIGTVATLTTGTGSNSNPWKPEDRFYGMWNSGSATSAIIQIVDLQTAASGNDFGLDDISFGTLSPLPATINPGVVVPLCEGSTISLTANLSNGKTPFTFAWTGPDGFTSALENPSIPNATIARSGVYTLTFFDGYGCTPLTGDVSVSVGAIATAEAGPAQSVCASSPSVTLAGVIGGSATSATWSGGTGTFNPNANTLNAIYTPGASEIIAGTATLTLTTNPSGPCSTVTDQVTITIYPAVTASIIASSGPLCNGGSDGFATALGSGGAGPYLYSWNTTPVQTTATASNLSAGTYIVTVTGAHGCSDTETITLTEPPALLVDDNILTTHLTCYGDKNGTAKVTVISGLSPTYLWSDGQTTATATGLAGGSYIITVTSANGCAATALTAVIIEPIAPTIACPVDITKQADAGLTYATNVALTAPVYTNNCPMTVRTWTMTGVTTDSSPVTGIQLLTAHDFNIGITNINYTITDGAGNILNCTFGVTVLPNPPPVITCPTTILSNVDPGLCSANVTVIPATATGGGVTVVGVRSDGLPLTDPYPTGTVTITWTATNPYGTDFCTQLITVTDNIKPTFNVPAALEECVEIVAAATYNGATMDIDPDRPEYFTFVAGNTSLDLNPSTFGDNCPLSCVVEIRWKIDMHDGTRIPALPVAYQTGQPSAFGSDIRFLGDGVGHTNTIHTITYWIVDCSGNVSDPKTQTITIKPRPTIIGIN
jgi:subtilisin-like proprotein convertase family protein